MSRHTCWKSASKARKQWARHPRRLEGRRVRPLPTRIRLEHKVAECRAERLSGLAFLMAVIERKLSEIRPDNQAI